MSLDRSLKTASWYSPLESDPASVGMEIVDSLEDETLSYAFDKLVVWKDVASGDLYYAEDSGRSWPVPFEDVSRLSDLTRLGDFASFEGEARAWNAGYGDRQKVGAEGFQTFLRTVREALG